MADGLVYVVDDDSDLAQSVGRLIGRAGYSVRTFLDPEELLRASAEQPPECVVSDVMMGTTGGFELAERMKSADPAVAMIFMTAWPKTSAAVDAVRTGSVDYLEKPIDEERLFQALERGVAWSRTQRATRARLARLTAREWEVFHLLCQGLSNKMIAGKLGIHPKTIEDHRAAIMRKTQTNSLAQLIALHHVL